MLKKMGRRKLAEKDRLSCLVPIKLTPPEYRTLIRLAKLAGAQYICRYTRDLVIERMKAAEAEEKKA